MILTDSIIVALGKEIWSRQTLHLPFGICFNCGFDIEPQFIYVIIEIIAIVTALQLSAVFQFVGREAQPITILHIGCHAK